MKRQFIFLRSCIDRNQKHLYRLLLIGVCDIGLALFMVGITRSLIDVASGNRVGILWKQILLLLVCMVLSVLLRGIFSRYTVWLQAKLRNLLVGRFFSSLLRACWLDMKKFHSGDIMSRMERDTDGVVTLLVDSLPWFVLTFLKLCGALVYLYMMDSRLAFVLAALVPVVLLLSKLYLKKMRLFSRLLKKQWSAVCQFFQEAMQNREMLKALMAEPECGSKLSCLQGTFMYTVNRQNHFSFYSNAVVMLGFAIGYLITFSWGLYGLKNGTLTFGSLMVFLQLVNMIQGPSLALAQLLPGFLSSYTAIERLQELDALQPEPQEHFCLSKGVDMVEFRNASFMYEPGKPLLDKLNWSFERGKMYALTGKTGCGKTTVLRLLLGFVNPDAGAIRISGGGEVMEVDAGTRANFAYVPQDYALISGSIRDNLRLGRAQATDGEMIAALRQAEADFVFGLPEGLETRLNERGEGLSGGQAQRLAIARALLMPGDVLLFDEFTSALDDDTEYKVIASLKKHTEHRIVILISHKRTVIEACDCVYRL